MEGILKYMENIESPLKNFLQIPYDQLETMNLEAKKRRSPDVKEADVRAYYREYLEKETRIKAVTIGFSDLEGRFHMLDYDKRYFLKNDEALTFDGSSVHGFSRQAESDLRLRIDWKAFWWLPSDIFGPGKVLIMGDVMDKDGITPYEMDIRGILKAYLSDLYTKKGYTVSAANEIEGFLLTGEDAEKNFNEREGFHPAAHGGYYHSLPTDVLRTFIDKTAEAQRALGFENEKDHPEVAPSQFELNYSYSDAIIAADQILLYKVVARQVAKSMGMTATFLPKPVMGINGSGMHTNLSISQNGTNLFYDPKGNAHLSAFGWDIVHRILSHAGDICLALNSSVNAYRRLDPAFEAPNEIKVSQTDRGSMIRIPLFEKASARIEVRSVGPDANPYLLLFLLIKAGLEGQVKKNQLNKRPRVTYLPSTIQTAIAQFRTSTFITKVLGEECKKKFLTLKEAVADRSPRLLGTTVKNGEVLYHHEISNQMLWNAF
jgi:glutamine synthetase